MPWIFSRFWLTSTSFRPEEARIDPARSLAADREQDSLDERSDSPDARPGAGWREELALRVLLALLPCAVLVFHLRPVLGAGAKAWVVPLAMGFSSALVVVSIGRALFRGRRFLVFWAVYAAIWTAVAWHGSHFRNAPRPTALFMNLEEISEVPLPGWQEMPWGIAAGAVALGWVARRRAPPARELRRATLASLALFGALQGYAFIRFQTRDIVRYSEYRDLVRTHGLDVAALLDTLYLLRWGNAASVLREMRLDAASNPAVRLPLDPVSVNRIVILQLESVDREALTPEVAPTLLRFWEGATRGVVNPSRSSLSGSSSADFQLLTGLRTISPVPVYRLRWDGNREHLAAHAAARGFGFRVYHGNDRNFWNRGPFLSAMGAEFESIESIPESEHSRWGRADGDLLRHVAQRIRSQPRSVSFLITLSTHAPYDLIIPPGDPLEDAPVKTRYLHAVTYLDTELGKFLRALPGDGATLVALYSDHSSGVFDAAPTTEQVAVPMILGLLTPDGSLAPLTRKGEPVHVLPGTYELPALHRFLGDCLDASAP